MREGIRQDWLDRAAVVASAACVVHCLALPLVLAALPAAAAVVHVPASFHLWILVFAVPTSSYALVIGRARDGLGWPCALGMLGLGLLAIGALFLEGTPRETPVTLIGSLFLATAHVANWRERHR